MPRAQHRKPQANISGQDAFMYFGRKSEANLTDHLQQDGIQGHRRNIARKPGRRFPAMLQSTSSVDNRWNIGPSFVCNIRLPCPTLHARGHGVRTRLPFLDACDCPTDESTTPPPPTHCTPQSRNVKCERVGKRHPDRPEPLKHFYFRNGGSSCDSGSERKWSFRVR